MSIPDTTVTFTHARGQALLTPADLSHVWVEHLPARAGIAAYSRIEVVYRDDRSGEPTGIPGGTRVGPVKEVTFRGDDHEARSTEVFAAIAATKQTAGSLEAPNHLTFVP